MTLADVPLLRASNLLADRLRALEACIARGEDVWPECLAAAGAPAQMLPALAQREAQGRPVTQREVADALGCSERTIRRRAQRGAQSGAARVTRPIRWRQGPTA